MKKILITGHAGFIGSHVLRHFVYSYPEYDIHGMDSLTYAANLDNVKDIEDRYTLHVMDIRNREGLMRIFEREQFTDVIHLAAESHVDNSISNPLIFVETNILGTLNLLDAFRKYSTGRFHHVSTDEVYGYLHIGDPEFTETTPYDPSSPYSASKAASDHFVRAYHRTYGIDVTITNCSNNYGPNQNHEKFIPTVIRSIINEEPIPIYGKGENIRDWLFVGEHAQAIDVVFHTGVPGETYNVGGNMEMSNLDLVYLICDMMYERGWSNGNARKLITFVTDRPGHDFRYAIDSSKLSEKLRWSPYPELFRQNLLETIDWFSEIYNLKPSIERPKTKE